MKRNVLIVDNDPNLRENLQTVLPIEEWEPVFANDGAEALHYFDQTRFDVIITDTRMKDMDGAELLHQVNERSPQTIRLLLSEAHDREIILRAAKSAHQILLRPCDANNLKITLRQACLMQGLLKDEKLEKLVTGIDHLPSLPRLYTALLKEVKKPNFSLKRVGDLIAQDVTMTAEILKLINSAFFGLPHYISNPHQAVVLLGIDSIKGLVLHVQIFSAIHRSSKFEPVVDAMWEHSLKVGALAKKIAETQFSDRTLADDALVAGMLHDVGKLILLQLPHKYNAILKDAEEHACDSVESEYHILNASHAEIGAYLLALWGLPSRLVDAVTFHHFPTYLTEEHFSPLTAVHVANALIADESRTFTQQYAKLNYDYLTTLHLLDRLPSWEKLAINQT